MEHASYLVEIVVALAATLAVVFVCALLLKRFGAPVGTSSGGMSVIASLALSSKERLIVVEISGEQVLLGVSPGQIRMLTSLATPIASEDAQTPGFASILKGLRS
ncbi:MAG: flagellar biosynthetic protein FliO [Pseudomonadaceae bacterium]|nr:flagellar biosynthetic protein FliO [Pseudomonadaceae bacterium]